MIKPFSKNKTICDLFLKYTLIEYKLNHIILLEKPKNDLYFYDYGLLEMTNLWRFLGYFRESVDRQIKIGAVFFAPSNPLFSM